MRGGSQFNYHRKQLVGQFVRHTDDGYEFRRAGHQLVRTVIAGGVVTGLLLSVMSTYPSSTTAGPDG